MKKSTQLKQLINSPELAFIMEAHNGLSAKIVEEAGFAGIWASGLTISASLGVRDNNEASWTQILDVVEYMSDASRLPILLDGDTGYGNFNNVRRLVHKLEQRDIAGVCLEDKLFPKTNSFIAGLAQPLADMDEFAGKITAAKDSQTDSDFVVVARVEALIAGWGLEEALKRAEAYRQAGADAILMHSAARDVSEVAAFMKEWGNRHPVVIVPTKYYATPTEQFRELGVSLVIWANHTLRAAIAAMQETTQKIAKHQAVHQIEDSISPVQEVFRLQGADELAAAEQRYLPARAKRMNAIILAAAQGDVGPLTMQKPKALLNVQDKTILDHQLAAYRRLGITDLAIVRGFGKDQFTMPNITFVDNDDYAHSSEVYSLYLARDYLGKGEQTVISYGDELFRNYVMEELAADQHEFTIIADVDYSTTPGYHEYLATDVAYSKQLYNQAAQLERIFTEIPVSIPSPQLGRGQGEGKSIAVLQATPINGEFIGLIKISRGVAEIVKQVLERLSQRPDFKQLRMQHLLTEILQEQPIAVRFIHGSWLDVNTILDLQRAGTF